VIQKGAGGVTSKSVDTEGRMGHPNPVIVTYEGGMMNAVGLSNPGIEHKLLDVKAFKQKTNAPFILSLFAATVEEFVSLAKKADQSEADMIEVNISCPNVEDEFGKPFALCAGIPATVTKLVKKNTSKPVIIKLSPNVPNIGTICQEIEAAGADGVSLINTVGPGMMINIETAKPVLANKVGGMSGPAIKPIAIKAVYDAYKVVKIPIIGMGGITTGRDAIEIMMAGARLVGIGTAVYSRGPEVFALVVEEMTAWLEENGYKGVEEIIGLAHRE
jgi:dihydroorotate dehydrogenase (NAD+) catalytic subunit